jgi:hypothetical protein
MGKDEADYCGCCGLLVDSVRPDAAAQVRKTVDAILTANIPQTLFHLGLNESPSAGGHAAAQ